MIVYLIFGGIDRAIFPDWKLSEGKWIGYYAKKDKRVEGVAI